MEEAHESVAVGGDDSVPSGPSNQKLAVGSPSRSVQQGSHRALSSASLVSPHGAGIGGGRADQHLTGPQTVQNVLDSSQHVYPQLTASRSVRDVSAGLPRCSTWPADSLSADSTLTTSQNVFSQVTDSQSVGDVSASLQQCSTWSTDSHSATDVLTDWQPQGSKSMDCESAVNVTTGVQTSSFQLLDPQNADNGSAVTSSLQQTGTKCEVLQKNSDGGVVTSLQSVSLRFESQENVGPDEVSGSGNVEPSEPRSAASLEDGADGMLRNIHGGVLGSSQSLSTAQPTYVQDTEVSDELRPFRENSAQQQDIAVSVSLPPTNVQDIKMLAQFQRVSERLGYQQSVGSINAAHSATLQDTEISNDFPSGSTSHCLGAQKSGSSQAQPVVDQQNGTDIKTVNVIIGMLSVSSGNNIHRAGPHNGPQIGSPQIGSPQMANPQMANPQNIPQVGSPQIGSPLNGPQMGSPQNSPQLGSPQNSPQMVSPQSSIVLLNPPNSLQSASPVSSFPSVSTHVHIHSCHSINSVRSFDSPSISSEFFDSRAVSENIPSDALSFNSTFSMQGIHPHDRSRPVYVHDTATGERAPEMQPAGPENVVDSSSPAVPFPQQGGGRHAVPSTQFSGGRSGAEWVDGVMGGDAVPSSEACTDDSGRLNGLQPVNEETTAVQGEEVSAISPSLGSSHPSSSESNHLQSALEEQTHLQRTANDASTSVASGHAQKMTSQHTFNSTSPDDGSDISPAKPKIVDFSPVVGTPSDITLEVGERQFLCHKSVLCRESPCFQAMFESGMKESRSEKVSLSDTNPDHFQLLLKYFYTGELKLSESNVNGLTELSSMYQASRPLRLCCNFLITVIEDDLCLSLMRMANFLMLTDVYNQARRHALWHFETVSQVEDFFLAPAAQVVDYLQDSYLNVNGEMEVMEAAAAWYQAQEKPCEVTDVENFFADAVNFHLLKVEEIAAIQRLPLMEKDKALKKFAISLGQPDVLARLQSKHSGRTRTSPKNGRILCVGAHQCQPAVCKDSCMVAQHNTAPLDIMQFHPDTCSLEPVCNLFDIFHTNLALDSGYRVCAIGHEVYVCGGEAALGRSVWLNTIWCLDTLRVTWREVGQLKQPRRHHGLCAHKHSLFLVGGIGRYRIRLSTVESFDTITHEWTKHPDMIHQETAPAVTEHNGFIYVFKNCFQMYNIARRSWTYIQLYPSGAVPGLPVYAHFDPSDSRSIFVSCFNSEILWQVDLDQSKCQRVCNFENEGGGAVLCRGCVYHYQLYDGHGVETEVECFDLEEKRKYRVGALQGAVLTSHFVTVPYFPNFVPSSSNLLC